VQLVGFHYKNLITFLVSIFIANIVVTQCKINGVAEDERRHGMGMNVEEVT
jgi:hypothetical protein